MSASAPTTKTEHAKPPFYIGIDVGGTSTKVGLVDDRGKTIGWRQFATEEERGPTDGVLRMSEVARQIVEESGLGFDAVTALGLATPGTMDIPTGQLLTPHNLPHWYNFPIRDHLRAAAGKPVTYANDANAAAFGEFWVGGGLAFSSIVMLTLGTGVGGGIIIDDVSINGENSHGSEIGHIIIDSSPNARLCGCGQRGHLESYASAKALIRRAKELLDEGRASSVKLRLARGEEITPLLLAQEAENGDELSLKIILEMARYLAVGIASCMHMVDPGAVILGGAMNFGGNETVVGRDFLQRVRDDVKSLTFPVLAKRTTVDFASLGSAAGYIGAAGIARVAHQKHCP